MGVAVAFAIYFRSEDSFNVTVTCTLQCSWYNRVVNFIASKWQIILCTTAAAEPYYIYIVQGVFGNI